MERNVDFIKKITKLKDVNFFLTEPTRLSTIYWTVNSYKIMQMNSEINKKETLEFVMNCKNLDGGFGGNIGYPSNVLSTFNALQILYILEHPYRDSTTLKYILGRINEDGSISNDEYGESDVRILCSGVLSLRLLELLSKGDFSRESLCMKIENLSPAIKFNIVEFIMTCYNSDGGFGCIPGGESHNAFTFCCLSSLRSLGAIETFGGTDICRFIALRQKENGGLSGRIGKKEDVCYSFWAYSSLKLLKRETKINETKLKEFILSCQSPNGGFSDRPGNEPDLYHLMFSLAALGLLGHEKLYKVDPGFCL